MANSGNSDSAPLGGGTFNLNSKVKEEEESFVLSNIQISALYRFILHYSYNIYHHLIIFLPV